MNRPILQSPGIASRIGTWAKKPFAEDMDLASIALLTVFVITVATLWNLALRKLIEA